MFNIKKNFYIILYKKFVEKIIYPNGDQYEGEWKNDKKEGKGYYLFIIIIINNYY